MNETTPTLSTAIGSLHQAIAQLSAHLTAKTEAPAPAVMRPKAAAAYLSMTLRALRSLVNKGAIPFRRQGRLYIFMKTDIDAWLAALPGITVEAALKTIKPEPTFIYVQQGILFRAEAPAPPAPPAPEDTARPVVSLSRGARRHIPLPKIAES